MNFLVHAATDVGIKKETNQDSLLIKTANTQIGRIAFAVMCDGMGGLAKGELASATVVHAFDEWFCEKLPELIQFGIEDNLIRQQWTNLVREQNEKIKKYGQNAGIELGTTACALLITEHRSYCLNVGDSRCYRITKDFRQITVDQTLVQREVDAGKITPEQAHDDPRRSILLQCIGCIPAVNPDIYYGTPGENDTYLLCSDGFIHELSSQEIYDAFNPDTLINQETMKQNSEKLIEINKRRGETDNITVLLIRTF